MNSTPTNISNTLNAILSHWHPKREQHDWVMGTLIDIEGSSYRRLGARLLINSLGTILGLISGGCLESDLRRQAIRVMQTGRAKTITYDMQDPGSAEWQLGIGCGGKVSILLSQITADNQYLGLEAVYEKLQSRQTLQYWLRIDEPSMTYNQTDSPAKAQAPAVDWRVDNAESEGASRSEHQQLSQQRWLLSHIEPDPHLLIFGGGVDARPLAALAAQLGWFITVVDRRVGYAKAEHFPNAQHIIHQAAKTLSGTSLLNKVDAAVVMTHNLTLDAEALQVLTHSPLRYLAVLGPAHRLLRVLEKADLKPGDLPVAIAGPAGLDLGGELPESIALSILAQCHATLHKRNAQALKAIQ